MDLSSHAPMRGLNKVTLLGNLGKNPELQELEGCIALAKFTLATSESYRDDKGNKHIDTKRHTILGWRKMAEAAGKHLKKGSTIYLEGNIKTRTYEDKSGVKKQASEIIADNIIILNKPSGRHSDTTDIYASPGEVA